MVVHVVVRAGLFLVVIDGVVVHVVVRDGLFLIIFFIKPCFRFGDVRLNVVVNASAGLLVFL